jgi:chorismate dehydratase
MPVLYESSLPFPVRRGKVRDVYDLGDAWKKYTGLPFVFATWTSTRELDQDFIREFDKANATGVQNIPNITDTIPYTLFDMKEYFTKYVRYNLDDEKRRGLSHFLELLQVKHGRRYS